MCQLNLVSFLTLSIKFKSGGYAYACGVYGGGGDGGSGRGGWDRIRTNHSNPPSSQC